MSFSFPPIYQNYINLWSPFSRVEPISQVYNEKVDQIQSITLYNKKGQLVEYTYGNSPQSKRV